MRSWLSKGALKSSSLSTKNQMGGSLDIFGSWNAMVNWCQKIDTSFKLSGGQMEESSVFKVFPQPMSHSGFLNIEVLSEGWVELYSFMGEKVGEWKVGMGRNEINLGVEEGMYSMVFTSGEKKIKKIKILVD